MARDETPHVAFEKLFRETRADLVAHIVRRAGSAEEAADILAETYLIAWRKLDSVPAGEGGRPWLFGVARNLILQGAGKRRSDDRLLRRIADELPRKDVAMASVDDQRIDAVRSALADLPAIDREIPHHGCLGGADAEADRERAWPFRQSRPRPAPPRAITAQAAVGERARQCRSAEGLRARAFRSPPAVAGLRRK
jgi:hypothetical protein